jgi:glycosyltransferase involved in cell wall biosynthesis
MQSNTIAIAINSSWNIYNFRSGLIRALVEAGYEVLAIAPVDAYSSRLSELGCRFAPVRLTARGTSPLEDAKLFLDYRRVLKRHRPAAFLGYTIKPNVYGSLAAHSLGIPVINNIAGLGVTFLKHGLFQRFIRTLYRMALRRSRTVFFQNPDDRGLFLKAGLVHEAQTELLPGSGIDLKRFAPVQRERGEDDPFVFLLVSRLLRSKGIEDYVAAAEAVRREFPKAEFQIAGIIEQGHGDAIKEEELQRWSASGAITYLGALDDVRPALAKADVVVLPTFYPEGTPRALLEAASMAKPLITTNVPGCRAVLDDSVNGFLVEPREAETLTGAMLRMLRIPGETLQAMGAASRRKAEAEFDERIVVSRYLDAIAKALSGRAA